MLAAQLNESLFDVSIYEQNKTAARKLLVAGKGGLNISHAEDINTFVTRYTPSNFLENCIRSFSNTNFRNWLYGNGIDTYIGSSNRIFPAKELNATDVLNTFLSILKIKKIEIHFNHKWIGWSTDGSLIFKTTEGTKTIKANRIIFALGGGSYSITGSDGKYLHLFNEREIKTSSFEASNCAYKVEWLKDFIEKWHGQWIKNIAISCSNQEKKGEIILTQFGMEGGAIYAHSSSIRKQLQENKKAIIYIDLKPTLSIDEIKKVLNEKNNQSLSEKLKDQLKISKSCFALLKNQTSKEVFIDTNILAEKIKQLPIIFTASASLDEAISSVGGIELSELNANFEFKKLPHHYAIGEMLNWDAPTGGYLLHACFSMGWYLAEFLNSDE